METIAKLIEVALEECHELGVVELPLEGLPPSLQGECEIELHSFVVDPAYPEHRSGDYYVDMFDVLCIIDMDTLECWHSEKLAEETAQP